MQRRRFLKNTIGAFLLAGLNSNKTLASIVETLSDNSPKILLYLIQANDGQWKIKATKWVDLYKQKRLQPCKVKKETFKALDIVDYKDATKRKYELWKEYNCTGKLAPVKILKDVAAGKKALSSEKYINYLGSEKAKTNHKKRIEASKIANSNISEELRREKAERIRTLMLGKKHTDESKLKMSRNSKGKTSPNKGKKLTKEWKEKLSQARLGKSPWNKGKKMSEQYRKKISEAQKGKFFGRSVICYLYPSLEFYKEYRNLSTACKELNLDTTSARMTCNGLIKKTTGKKRGYARLNSNTGYTFRYSNSTARMT